MPEDAEGNWIPDLFDKQFQVFNCYHRALLVSGPRLSGKSIAVLHKIVRHLFETPNARVAMFSKTMKTSKQGGTWKLLHTVVLKEWIDAGVTEYTTKGTDGTPGAKVDGIDRTPYFRIRNAFGGESELLLFSLDYTDDVENKLKEMQFSMIYFSELDKFDDRKVLSVALLSLRMQHLKYEQHMWIADTNPSEEGESSWIYKVWFVERIQDYPTYVSTNKKLGLPIMEEEDFTFFQKGLELIEILPHENTRLDPRQLQELRTTYSYDIGLYSRYLEGKWVFGQGDSSRHFRGYFKENLHQLGNISSVNEDEWETIVPTPNCVELGTGWDLGDVNHAFVACEKQEINDKAHFTILDELLSIKLPVPVDDFTMGAMELIKELEGLAGHEFNLERAYSDRSSLEKYNSTGDTFQHLVVAAASGGRILLQGVPKGPGSVKPRVQLLKRLLHQGRIKVSAHCVYTIRMLNDLKKGSTVLTYVVPDENKHIFDALTYYLLMECAEDELDSLPTTGNRPLLLAQM